MTGKSEINPAALGGVTGIRKGQTEIGVAQIGWEEHPPECECRRCRRRAKALARRKKPRYGQVR